MGGLGSFQGEPDEAAGGHRGHRQHDDEHERTDSYVDTQDGVCYGKARRSLARGADTARPSIRDVSR